MQLLQGPHKRTVGQLAEQFSAHRIQKQRAEPMAAARIRKVGGAGSGRRINTR